MTSNSSYNIEWAAWELNVSVAEVEDLIRAGKLRKKVVGSRRFVPASDIQAILRDRNEAPSSPSYDKHKAHERPARSEDQQGKENQKKTKDLQLVQQHGVPHQPVSRNDRSFYCPVDDAAERLNKSIGQVRQLIRDAKLRSAVFGGERMVLISDVERLAQRSLPDESWRKDSSPQSKAQMQRDRVVVPSDSNKDNYCTLTNAAQKLNKSINQIKGLIEAGKLRSEVFGAQRMVLRKDVDLLSQDKNDGTREHETTSPETVEYSKWSKRKAESESEHDKAQEATSRIRELEEELESLQSQLASERELWKEQIKQEGEVRKNLESDYRDRIKRLSKETYSIKEDLEVEKRDRREEVQKEQENAERERSARLNAEWKIQELELELGEVREARSDPFRSIRRMLWPDEKQPDETDKTGEPRRSSDSRIEELQTELEEEKRLRAENERVNEVVRSELEEERQRQEESEKWVRDLQSERDSLQAELTREQAQRDTSQKQLQAAKAEQEEYVQKLLSSKDQALERAREQASRYENEKNLLDEIRRLLSGQPASEAYRPTHSTEDGSTEVEGYLLDTPYGQYRFVPPFLLEDNDLELLRLVATHGELTADQIRKQTGRRRAVGDLDDLLDSLEERGVVIIEVVENRYRLDVTKLHSD